MKNKAYIENDLITLGRHIREMTEEGKTDKKISKKLGLPLIAVMGIRNAIGIHKRGGHINGKWHKVSFFQSGFCIKTLSLTKVSDALGITVNGEQTGKAYHYKIKNAKKGKLTLVFKETD